MIKKKRAQNIRSQVRRTGDLKKQIKSSNSNHTPAVSHILAANSIISDAKTGQSQVKFSSRCKYCM